MSEDHRVWHHIVLTTYGAWLYGDARGFRTRHHREHIDGDYKNPPPLGEHADIERISREALKQPAVVLSVEWRAFLGPQLQTEFHRRGAWVLILAVAPQHVHVLAKLTAHGVREFVGKVKRRVALRAMEHGWQGRLWGVRSKAIRIRDRAHHGNAFRYIRAHAAEGAWVGECRVEPPRSELE